MRGSVLQSLPQRVSGPLSRCPKGRRPSFRQHGRITSSVEDKGCYMRSRKKQKCLIRASGGTRRDVAPKRIVLLSFSPLSHRCFSFSSRSRASKSSGRRGCRVMKEDRRRKSGRETYNGRSSGRLKCAAVPSRQRMARVKIKIAHKNPRSLVSERAELDRGSSRLEMGRAV